MINKVLIIKDDESFDKLVIHWLCNTNQINYEIFKDDEKPNMKSLYNFNALML